MYTTKTLRDCLRSWAGQLEWALHVRYELLPQKRPPELRKYIAQKIARLMRVWGLSRSYYQNRQWLPGLKHGAAEGNIILLIWSDIADMESSRAACAAFRCFLSTHPQYVPVLVTSLADFAFYSRLGWLVEYLPQIPGEGPNYTERKRCYLAWRYRHAEAVPLSIGLGDKIEASLVEAYQNTPSIS